MNPIIYSAILTPLVTNLGGETLINQNFVITNIMQFLSIALGWGLVIGAVIVFGCLVISGFQWATAGNEPSKAKSARDNITNCIFGFGILASTYAVALIVQFFVGTENFKVTPPGPVTPPTPTSPAATSTPTPGGPTNSPTPTNTPVPTPTSAIGAGPFGSCTTNSDCASNFCKQTMPFQNQCFSPNPNTFPSIFMRLLGGYLPDADGNYTLNQNPATITVQYSTGSAMACNLNGSPIRVNTTSTITVTMTSSQTFTIYCANYPSTFTNTESFTVNIP